MSEYMFGAGPGWLPEKANKIAKRNGATLVNYTDAQCNCGWGCRPYSCKKSRRHWFATTNLGSPFDQQTERDVMADLAKAGIGATRKPRPT